MSKKGPVYRVCRSCGNRVNVSSQERQEKKYLCPRCRKEPWFMTRDALCYGIKWTKNKEVKKMTNNIVNIDRGVETPFYSQVNDNYTKKKAIRAMDAHKAEAARNSRMKVAAVCATALLFSGIAVGVWYLFSALVH